MITIIVIGSCAQSDRTAKYKPNNWWAAAVRIAKSIKRRRRRWFAENVLFIRFARRRRRHRARKATAAFQTEMIYTYNNNNNTLIYTYTQYTYRCIVVAVCTHTHTQLYCRVVRVCDVAARI